VSVNRERPHVLVLPEDDANRQLANGFQLEIATNRQFQVLPPAGGWLEVLSQFEQSHIAGMNKFSQRLMILLIDFDDQARRRADVTNRIPAHLRDRVFLLGADPEPEFLKRDLGSYETIGRNLAKDCRDGTTLTWQHRCLGHNAIEVNRLREYVRPLLF